MSEQNTLPSAAELEAQTNIDLTISQMPLLQRLDGNAITMVVTKGRNYSMRIDDLAASLSESVVSGSDLEKKADATSVTDLEERVDTLERRSATKSEVGLLSDEVTDLSAKKATKVQVGAIETRVNALENRTATTEANVTRLTETVQSQGTRLDGQDAKIEAQRLVAADAKATANESSIVAARAEGKGNQALQETAALKGKVDAHAISISSLQNSRDQHAQRIADNTTSNRVNAAAVERIDGTVTRLDGRVTTIESKLGDFAQSTDVQDLKEKVIVLDEEIHTLNGQIDSLKQKDVDQDAEIAAIKATHAGDMNSIDLRLASMQTQIDDLKARVDAIGGPDSGVFPLFASTGNVSNPDPNNGKRVFTVQSLIRDAKGVPLETAEFHLEIDRGAGWGRMATSPFVYQDGGATVSAAITVTPGEVIRYRSVLTDKWRPTWIKHQEEFVFTGL